MCGTMKTKIMTNMSITEDGTVEDIEPQGFSPPQFQKRAMARESIHKLEDRLEHFIEWLMEQEIWLECGAGALHQQTIKKLIVAYVES